MADKASRTIRIRWVRSGIGFPYRVKDMIRSLGLRRLNQVVERPDTPQIRGLVARIPHLVEVVTEAAARARLLGPEYTISPPDTPIESPKKAVGELPEEVMAGGPTAKVEERVAQATPKQSGKPSAAREVEKPAKRAAGGKGKAAKLAETKKTEKAAGKGSKPAKKVKK